MPIDFCEAAPAVFFMVAEGRRRHIRKLKKYTPTKFMQRELSGNEKALEGVGDEFNSAEKQADQFGDEVKKASDTADDAGGRFEKLGSVLKGVGTALAAGVVAIGTAAIAAGKSLVDMPPLLTEIRSIARVKS